MLCAPRAVQGIQRLYEEGEEPEEPDEGVEGGAEEEEEEEEEREKECRDREGLCERPQNKDQPTAERRSRRLKSEVGTKDDGKRCVESTSSNTSLSVNLSINLELLQ